MTNLLGADISFYQDKPETPQRIDFDAMRNAGVSFVIIRAGQNTWSDALFADSWRRSKGVLPRGSYWFYDSRAKPKDQAEKWRETVGDDLPECGVWMDFEEGYAGPYRSEDHLKEFAELVQDLFPSSVEVGVYTAYYWWMGRVKDTKFWHQFALWAANYNVTKPLIPAPWSENEWTFWQYTAKANGSAYGVESGSIDLNYFNGDEKKFKEVFGLVVAPPAPVPPADETKKIEVTVTRKDTGASVTVEI